MKKFSFIAIALFVASVVLVSNGYSASFEKFKFWGSKAEIVTPANGKLEIPIADLMMARHTILRSRVMMERW